MNIKKLAFASLMLAGSSAAMAENTGAMFFTTPANYQVLSISENGLWACGVISSDDGDTVDGFRWNLSTGKIELIGTTGLATCVANDGTVATSYFEPQSNGTKVESPYLWKDGKWTPLQVPTGMVSGWAYAISPDGKHVTGSIEKKDGTYASFIWNDGKLTNNLDSPATSMTYCISPDGQRAGGWMYGGSNKNRCCGYWEASDNSFHYLVPDYPGAAWQAAKKFSADGNHVLFWGGYHSDENHPELGYGIKALYDFTSGETKIIYPTEQDPFNFDLFDMSGDGVVVGYQQDWSNFEQAIIYKDGKTMFLEDYLVGLGCKFDDSLIMPNGEYHYLCRGCAVSGDAQSFAILYYDTKFNYHTMIVALDRDLSMTPPVNVEAEQLVGLKVVSLTWDEPLGDKSDLKGYNVYRNGEKINAELVTERSYYDKNVAEGDYVYTITAVYGEGESKVSNTVKVTVCTSVVQAPRDVLARTRGFNGTHVSWAAPASNLVPCTYVSENAELQGFGGGDVSFESGTLFPADRMGLYAGNRLTAVSFYPGSEQGSWLINVYTHNDGQLTNLGSFKVSQELTYGVENIVLLPRQITLQEDHDLLIGIQTNVTTSSYNVQGCFEGCLQTGYTDLIRQVGDADFYSINEMSQAGTYDMAWGTTAFLAPAGVSSDIDKVDHYNVFVDDFLQGESTTLSYDTQNIAEGAHNVGVQAVYTDGRTSAIVNDEYEQKKNADALKAVIPAVEIAGQHIVASWEAPVDDDATEIGYCGDENAKSCPSTSADMSEFVARVDFYTSGTGYLNGFEGYNISSVSFYPMADAFYEGWFYINGELKTSQAFPSTQPNQWNTFQLAEPILIERGKTYAFGLDMYGIPEGVAPLGFDKHANFSTYSDLYQLPGSDWSNVGSDVGLNGNWMMRIGVTAPEGIPFQVEGYDVFIDDQQVANKQSMTDFAYDFAQLDDAPHAIRVNTYYGEGSTYVPGEEVRFHLVPEGLEIVKMSSAALRLFNVDGRRLVAPRHGVNIFQMSDGSARRQIVR